VVFCGEDDVTTLNEVFSNLSASRRYEVWFLRLGLEDGAAWWFRYLLTNPGRGGCKGDVASLPVQVWATWFPVGEKPQTFIQQFPLSGLELSGRKESPFHFRIGENAIEENFCRGSFDVDGHTIRWNLHYQSTFRVTLSNKGWIGFSRTPHSDAIVSGEIEFDGKRFAGEPLATGLQGHNCGYRHRKLWRWAHVYFAGRDGPPSTFEALVYEMPLGLLFRKAVLWHDGKAHVFRQVEERVDREQMRWRLGGIGSDGLQLEATIDGSGIGVQRLPYTKTDCSGSFEVANNSLASARVILRRGDGSTEELETGTGAVLEFVG
jgi:hypothetical protein